MKTLEFDSINEIIEIEDLDDEWLGYCIKTEKDTIEFKLWNGSSCCEKFYMDTSDVMNSLLGNKLISCDIDVEDCDLSVFDPKSDVHECNGAMIYNERVIFKINTDNDPVYLVFGNIHNGYYSHRCEVILNGNCVCESWV